MGCRKSDQIHTSRIKISEKFCTVWVSRVVEIKRKGQMSSLYGMTFLLHAPLERTWYLKIVKRYGLRIN